MAFFAAAVLVSPRMSNESTIVDCACGARYEREVRTLPIKDIGAFECVDCGVRLEIWSGRKVPLFKRLKDDTPRQKRA